MMNSSRIYTRLYTPFRFYPGAPFPGGGQVFVLISLLLSTGLVNSIKDNECDYTLSDSPREGKVVHTFHTSCQGGEIIWRYPFSGLELTFKRPQPPSYIPTLRPHVHGEDGLRFCYVVAKTTANVTMLREMPGPSFVPGDVESCLSPRTLTFEPMKFYIESTPSLHSSLLGKFQMFYEWAKPTPFELCRRCSDSELATAVCSSRNIFTGQIENPGRVKGSMTVSVSDILRFDQTNLPKRFCLQRRRRSKLVIPPHHHKSNDGKSTEESRPSFFQHHKCDEIVIPFNGKCSFPLINRKSSDDQEFIFIADTSLQRFKPRCVLPLRKFWKTWKSLESKGDTNCLL